MKVGFFSPMPPARSGIADHAVQLLSALQTSALRGEASVELSASRADVNLYHLGNNQLHADIYRRALREPGVVILHDAVLHHFLLGFLNRDEYIAEFTLNYGLWSSGTASELWQNRARSAADHRYFDFPMARRIAERSRAIIVHNPAAERIVRNHCPGARVV
ncbi:MAG: hypothetical protein H7Y20_06560, partial [Bryobacteraceae bacterium]|nr:hypothetical protein [Bryobacteraceae bacterium]